MDASQTRDARRRRPDVPEPGPRTVCASRTCDYQVPVSDPGRYCPWCGQDLVTLPPSSPDPSAPGPEGGAGR
jgi:hypothetical protein